MNRFSLKPQALPSSEAVQSEVWLDGKPTEVRVFGTVLERQFQVNTKYLLMTTYGSPFEDSLHMYLLSEAVAILDERELEAP